MDLKDITKLEELSGSLSLLTKGTKFLAQWLESRTQERYEEFIRAAIDAKVMLEIAEALTADDLFAMLKALELDMEGEKAILYGRLACSIAAGKVTGYQKRHFIKSLTELSFEQADLLRRAWIANQFDLYPGAGSGRREPKEFLGIDSPNSINRLTFERLGMLEQERPSREGIQFIEACYTSDELTPEAADMREWAAGRIHIVCNEMGTPECDLFLRQLTDTAHRDAIRVSNGAVMRGNSSFMPFSSNAMVLLLTHDSNRLAEEWTAIESVIRKSVPIVVASTDPSIHLAPELIGFERIDASRDRVGTGVQIVMTMFEQAGLRTAT